MSFVKQLTVYMQFSFRSNTIVAFVVKYSGLSVPIFRVLTSPNVFQLAECAKVTNNNSFIDLLHGLGLFTFLLASPSEYT